MRRLLLVIALSSAGGVAAADPAPAAPTGLAVGVEAGEPTAATVRWAGPRALIGAEGAVGSGTWSGAGLYLHGDVVTAPVVVRLGDGLGLVPYLGLGVRHYRHGYEAMSIDEIPDVHTGVYLSVGAGLALSSGLEIYLAVRPGIDVARSDSCTFASGVDTVCPHQQSSRAFVDGVIGARWYLGR